MLLFLLLSSCSALSMQQCLQGGRAWCGDCNHCTSSVFGSGIGPPCLVGGHSIHWTHRYGDDEVSIMCLKSLNFLLLYPERLKQIIVIVDKGILTEFILFEFQVRWSLQLLVFPFLYLTLCRRCSTCLF